MRISIHAPGAEETRGPAALLFACHDRIRRFLALAREIGAQGEAPPEQLRAACAQVSHYFRVALPLHVRDEEQSIAPRLRGRREGLDAALARMESEHAGHPQLLDALHGALAAVHAEPGSPAPRQALLEAVDALEQDFEAHLKAEEQILLPAVEALFSEEEADAALAEMRARRRPGRNPAFGVTAAGPLTQR